MTVPPKEFYSQRLSFRPPLLTDAEALFTLYTRDPEVSRHLIWQTHKEVAETVGFLSWCIDSWTEGSAYPFIIQRRLDDQILGMIELRPENGKASLGYVLAKQFWGQGYMSEAVRAWTDWLLTQPEIWRVWTVAHIDNPASKRVLEKAGFKMEGILRRWERLQNISPEPQDCFCLSRLKGE